MKSIFCENQHVSSGAMGRPLGSSKRPGFQEGVSGSTVKKTGKGVLAENTFIALSLKPRSILQDLTKLKTFRKTWISRLLHSKSSLESSASLHGTHPRVTSVALMQEPRRHLIKCHRTLITSVLDAILTQPCELGTRWKLRKGNNKKWSLPLIWGAGQGDRTVELPATQCVNKSCWSLWALSSREGLKHKWTEKD